MIVLFLVVYLHETDSKALGPVSGVRWEVEGGVDAPEVYSALSYKEREVYQLVIHVSNSIMTFSAEHISVSRGSSKSAAKEQ